MSKYTRPKFMNICLLVFVILFAGCSTLSPLRPTVNHITSSLNQISEDTIWNGFDLKKYPIIMVSQKNETAFLYVNGKTQKWPYKSVPEDLRTRSFSYTKRKINNIHNMFVSLDDPRLLSDVDPIIHLIVHEAFHIFYQADHKLWKPNLYEHFQRGQEWPIKAHPRYYRWMMLQELLDYTETSNPEHLKKYSSWYFLWSKSYPQEFHSFLDRHEGSAQYVSIVALRNLTAKNTGPKGCVEIYKNRYPSSFEKYNMDFESEAYLLGALTGCILNSLQSTAWQEEINTGISSQHLLARLYKSQTHVKENMDEIKAFEDRQKDKMKNLSAAEILRIFTENYKKNNFNFVAVDIRIVKSTSFEADGIYLLDDRYNYGKTFSFIHQISKSDMQSSIDNSPILKTLKPYPTLMFDVNPCAEKDVPGRAYTTFALEKNLFKGKRLKKTVTDFLLYKEPTEFIEAHNALWLCIK